MVEQDAARPSPRRVILDCDPGIDDALAILLALRSPEIRLETITTVAGNVPLERTAENALKLTELAGRPDVPVAAGAAAPLEKKLEVADFVHGSDGLGGLELPPPKRALDPRPAWEVLAQTVLGDPEPVTIVAVGPLTNIALALEAAPDLAWQVEELIVMGGAECSGNATPAAEYNVYADPDAAQKVLGSGAQITLLTLEATRQAPLRREHLEALRIAQSPVARAAAYLGARYLDFAASHGADAAALHDPLAVGLAIDRSFAKRTVSARVEVETRGEFTYGATVIDRRLAARPLIDAGEYLRRGEPEPVAPNVRLPVEIDGDRFAAFLVNRLAR